MAEVACRKFTLMDAMILVGGVAVGILGARDLLVGDFGGDWVVGVLTLSEFFLMLASGLVLVFGLFRPRAAIVGLLSRPGLLACLLPLIVAVANDLVSLSRGGWDEVGPVGEWAWLLLGLPDRRWAFVVPIGWISLLLGRRWTSGAGWIDRSGRVVGWLWIAWGLVGAFL